MKEGKDEDEEGKDEEEGKEDKRKGGQLPVHGRQVKSSEKKEKAKSTFLESAKYYPSLPTFAQRFTSSRRPTLSCLFRNPFRVLILYLS
ncbi:hypothetical protein E2C01_101901 [Portunus trituberculatus]|uniref:Uncharacterized protein n=1 Tax=Portunus trituberculatus TaxID=210409 RepID=A0A5B7K6S4_PORTR|nr:hypothetical protein [Portunus trituberculatus]